MDHWPPYMSNVIIELWAAPTSAGAQQQQQQQEEKKQKEEPLYVRVLYNKEPIMFEGAPKGKRQLMHGLLHIECLQTSDLCTSVCKTCVQPSTVHL